MWHAQRKTAALGAETFTKKSLAGALNKLPELEGRAGNGELQHILGGCIGRERKESLNSHT